MKHRNAFSLLGVLAFSVFASLSLLAFGRPARSGGPDASAISSVHIL